MKRKPNEHFHVYILFSKSNPCFVKIGKANNLKRIPYLKAAGYGGITDWEHAVTLPVKSNHAALTLEAMISSRLTLQGYKLPKIMWDDLTKPGRRVGATECYNCHIDKVIETGLQMADVYGQFIEGH